MPLIVKFIIVILAGYLIGNVNFSIIISKLKKSDIRSHGSGNPGTMNMTRTFGVKIGVLIMALDMLKGVLSALIGFWLLKNNSLASVGLFTGGLSAIIGHIYPVLYNFKGGKGIATTLGVFLVSEPILFWLFMLIGFIYLLIFEFGSVSSLFIVAGCVCLEAVRFKGNQAILLLLYAIFLVTWWAHRTNIYKLLIGKENKVKLIKRKQVKKYKQIEKINQLNNK